MASTAPEQKLISYGTALWYSLAGSVYTQLFDCMLATPPDLSCDEAEVTVLDSPAGAKERIASWIDLGKMPFSILYAGTGSVYNTLSTIFFAGDPYFWKFQLPLLAGQSVNAQFIVKGFLSKLKLTEGKAGDNAPFTIEAEITLSTATSYAFTIAS